MTNPRKLSMGRAALAAIVVMTAGLVGGCPSNNNGDGDGNGNGVTLEGTWTGNVTYLAGLKLGDGSPSGTPFERSFTVTFDAQGNPTALDLPFDANQVAILSNPAGIRQGDTLQATVQVGGGGGTPTTVNITAVVSSASATSTTYNATLDLTVEYVGLRTLSGTHTIAANVQGDGTLSWNGNGQLDVPLNNGGGATLSLAMTATGTLTKQP